VGRPALKREPFLDVVSDPVMPLSRRKPDLVLVFGPNMRDKDYVTRGTQATVPAS
jgi:hypothetical protein